jgi:hypothetical protein
MYHIRALVAAGLTAACPAVRAGAQADVRPATIVLVPRLRDTLALAEVWRRSDIEPHDVIMLTERNATVGALVAAVQSLVNLRRAQQDSVVVDARVSVYEERVPASWQGMLRAVAADDLEKLKKSPPTSVPPLGMVPSREIYITSAKKQP